MVLILLANTDLQCNFVHFYQTTLQASQIGSQIIWQFVSAALTDRTESWAQWFLLGTLVSQTACDVAMYLKGTNRIVLLILFIVRFSLVQQIGNSIGKIFKMRIQLVMELEPDDQMSAFNILSITGDFLGRLVAVCGVYVVSLALFQSGKLTYDWLRDMFFIALVGWDIIAILCTVTISKSYFVPAPAVVDARVESRLEVARKSKSVSEKYEGKDGFTEEYSNPDDSVVGLMSGEKDEEYDADSPLLSGIIDDPGPMPTMTTMENLSAWQYLVYSCKSLVYNRLLILSLVHLWMVTTLLAFVTIVLRFDVTTQGVKEGPTKANFCGNLLINLIETQLWGEVCRLLGAVIYQGYMSQISPLHFYKAVYLVFAAINACMLTAVVFPLGPNIGSVVLGVITVFIYLSMIYSANISSVVMESAMAGFVFGVQGSVIQLLALVPVVTVLVTTKLHIPTPFITGYCVMHSVWSACFALYFALTSRKGLEALNDGTPSKSKVKKCLLGY